MQNFIGFLIPCFPEPYPNSFQWILQSTFGIRNKLRHPGSTVQPLRCNWTYHATALNSERCLLYSLKKRQNILQRVMLSSHPHIQCCSVIWINNRNSHFWYSGYQTQSEINLFPGLLFSFRRVVRRGGSWKQWLQGIPAVNKPLEVRNEIVEQECM